MGEGEFVCIGDEKKWTRIEPIKEKERRKKRGDVSRQSENMPHVPTLMQ